jgi:hypothetical protein
LSRTAPSLSGTLEKLGPFTDAALPTLDRLPYMAKVVNMLDDDTTIGLERIAQMVVDLDPIVSRKLAPVSDILDHSGDNIVAILANWAHAIQFRDGLSHVFRGEASFSPNTYETFIKAFSQQAGLPVRRDRPRPVAARPAPPTAPAPKTPAAKLPAKPKPLLDKTRDDVQNLLDTVLQPTVDKVQNTPLPLLDYLLRP